MPGLIRLLTLVAFAALHSGCAPKSELEAARSDLAEARRQNELLQVQRVPRPQYDAAQASLRAAGRRISELEAELQSTRSQLAATETRLLAAQTSVAPSSPPLAQSAAALASGTYEASNGTFVYSQDALINFGSGLQVSSPTGLMVSDPEHKVVAGELTIRTTKGLSMETTDGSLSAQPDGSVKFIGNSLMLRFAPPAEPTPSSSDAAQTSPDTPAPVRE